MDITFNAASRFLQRLAIPAFPQAYDRLVALTRVGNIVESFQQCFPEKWPDISSLGLHELDGDKLLILQQAATSAVAALFPVQEDYMDMLAHDDEPLQIHPDSCGFAWDDEWLSEVFQDPTQLQPHSDLAMFFKVLWIAATQFGEEDGRQLWERMQSHFGYPCDFPAMPPDVHARDFDWDRLQAALEAEGLGQFQRAIDLSLCDTGNLFLDTTPEEYGYGMLEIPDFTAYNILELKKIWAEAEAWLADYDTCRARLAQDPSIYARLARIWGEGCQKKSPSIPKTLIEIFGEGETDESHPTFP